MSISSANPTVATYTRYVYTATGGETSISGADSNGLILAYTIGKEQVFLNGTLLVRGSDYTATTGTSITGLTALVASDIVEILIFTSFSITDAVVQTLVDAKGDLLVGSADNAISRLAVGNSGETLVADSSATTGLRWQGNYAAGKNVIINGDFNIWQRGTSISYTGSAAVAYSADRWYHYTNGNGSWTFSRQTFTPGTAPVAGYEGIYFARASLPTAGTTTAINWGQRIENVQTFAGQTVTVSFWAKADTSRTVNFAFEQNFGSGGSATVTTNGGNLSITTSWARYSTTLAIPSIASKTVGTSSYLGMYINNGAVTNGFALDIWGVQLEAGNVATAFQTATGTLAGELAACQRYYFRFGGDSLYQHYALGMSNSATAAQIFINHPVPMRGNPGVLDFANLEITDNSTYNVAVTTLAITDAGKNGCRLNVGNNTGATANRTAFLRSANSLSGYIGLGAEL